MSRRKAWIWMTFALLCAIGAASLTYYTLQYRTVAIMDAQSAALRDAAPEPTARPSLQVPVAARQLSAGAVLDETAFVLKDFPLELVPSNAITSVARLEGKRLLASVAAGDIFRPGTLLDGEAASLSARIEPGKTVLAFPIADLMGELDVIRDGDYVDILLTFHPEASGEEAPPRITTYTVQRVEVLQVARQPPHERSAAPAPAALLLLVTPEDAVRIKYVKDRGGVVDLLLRSPLDEEPFDAPPASDQDLLTGLSESRAGAR